MLLIGITYAFPAPVLIIDKLATMVLVSRDSEIPRLSSIDCLCKVFLDQFQLLSTLRATIIKDDSLYSIEDARRSARVVINSSLLQRWQG